MMLYVSCISIKYINELQKKQRNLCNRNGSRQKQDPFVIMSKHRQNMSLVQITKMTKQSLIRADLRD